MSKYILREEGCNPFELTKEEYEEFAEMVRQNRAKRVCEEIGRLADTIGSEKTKAIVRERLKELM